MLLLLLKGNTDRPHRRVKRLCKVDYLQLQKVAGCLGSYKFFVPVPAPSYILEPRKPYAKQQRKQLRMHMR